MKKQVLSEELLRMKRLAGIISESQYAQKLNEGVPRASEWGGKYAVIIPGESENVQENKRMLREVMDNITDANTAMEWVYGQLDEYMDGLYDYGSGWHVEDRLEKLLDIISKKFNIPKGSFKISYDYDTKYNEYDEGTIDGTVSLNGRKIVDYSSGDDMYGFGGKIDKNALKDELAKFIKNSLNEELEIEGDYELPDLEAKKKP